MLLENSCEGTELGQTVAELGRSWPPSTPTRRSWAWSSTPATCMSPASTWPLPTRPRASPTELEAAGLTPYLAALHLNDAREACGSHRDRHAVPGDGTIGDGLRRLRAHPLFAPLPCILEIARAEVPQALAFLEP